MSFSPTFQHRLDTLDWRTIKHWFVVAMLVAGAFSAGNWVRSIKDHEIALPWLHQQAAIVPKVEAEAGCEHWRADKSAAIAKQAIKGALVDDAPIPDAASLPQDCAHVALPKQ